MINRTRVWGFAGRRWPSKRDKLDRLIPVLQPFINLYTAEPKLFFHGFVALAKVVTLRTAATSTGGDAAKDARGDEGRVRKRGHTGATVRGVASLLSGGQQEANSEQRFQGRRHASGDGEVTGERTACQCGIESIWP